MKLGDLRFAIEGLSDDLEIVVRARDADDAPAYEGGLTLVSVDYGVRDHTAVLALDCFPNDDDESDEPEDAVRTLATPSGVVVMRAGFAVMRLPGLAGVAVGQKLELHEARTVSGTVLRVYGDGTMSVRLGDDGALAENRTDK